MKHNTKIFIIYKTRFFHGPKFSSSQLSLVKKSENKKNLVILGKWPEFEWKEFSNDIFTKMSSNWTLINLTEVKECKNVEM